MKLGFIRRETKEEKLKFPFPYLDIEGVSDGGRVCKFWLKNARELFEFGDRDNKISWLYDENEEKKFYLVNVTDAGEEVTPERNVNLDMSFNDKPLYERMAKVLELKEGQHHYFELKKAEPIHGFPTVLVDAIPTIDGVPIRESNDAEITPNETETVVESEAVDASGTIHTGDSEEGVKESIL